ncbi:helix-turn-helix domain-containing protein [Chitiniphilus eburneus]|uniref:Helix-turn-helix domain-containing protein n=1 Tax=Chitiniphilus eburneus TaxID=2571148 RepID=A0A4U0QI17_9NEIS|nr:helix-turn-helix domain-containing protein [Chitiniphilus eburneus]TJZ75604.1 helix-turn-helix domain-containing protein [Chitiniphilus eburneus]
MSLEQELLRRRSGKKDAEIAAGMGKDASTVSKLFGGGIGVQLADLGALLDSLGLKFVDAKDMTITPSEMDALEEMAYRYLELRRRGAVRS